MIKNNSFIDKYVVHFVFSTLIIISFNTLAGQTVLYPQNIVAIKGEISSDQPISVLSVKDQLNQDDDWSKYRDFTPDSNGLAAEFAFDASQTDLRQLAINNPPIQIPCG